MAASDAFKKALYGNAWDALAAMNVSGRPISPT
jgi:hypothetical protein